MSREILVRRLALHTDRPFQRDGSALRLSITGAFPDNPILHNHAEDGYRYSIPLVRFFLLDGMPQLAAVKGGVPLLESIKDALTSMRVFNEVYQVMGWDIYDYVCSFGMCKQEEVYSFLHPWLGLNEVNYQKYMRYENRKDKETLLKNVLVGNIISLSKGFEYSIPDRIHVRIINMNECQTKLKGIPFLGFLGAFSVNFRIPDYWGIGKSISRGFGTIKRIQ